MLLELRGFIEALYFLKTCGGSYELYQLIKVDLWGMYLVIWMFEWFWSLCFKEDK